MGGKWDNSVCDYYDWSRLILERFAGISLLTESYLDEKWMSGTFDFVRLVDRLEPSKWEKQLRRLETPLSVWKRDGEKLEQD